MASDDSERRVPLGPVGRYVIDNLAELRAARRLTYKQLAELLEQLGRPIPPLGLSRIEKGTRRVDADDLVALAIALEVNPTALLLPRDVPSETVIDLAQHVRFPAGATWKWADGRIPLTGRPEITHTAQADFVKHARPRWDDGTGTLGTGPMPPIFRERNEELEKQEQWRAAMVQRMEDLERRLHEERARNGHDQEEPVRRHLEREPGEAER